MPVPCKLDQDNYEKLLDESPAYERYHRIIIQDAYAAIQQREENALGLTEEE